MEKENRLYITQEQYLSRLDEFKRYMYGFKKKDKAAYEAGSPITESDRVLRAYTDYATNNYIRVYNHNLEMAVDRKIDLFDNRILSNLTIAINCDSGSLSICHCLGRDKIMLLRDYIKHFEYAIKDHKIDPQERIYYDDYYDRTPSICAVVTDREFTDYKAVVYVSAAYTGDVRFNKESIKTFVYNVHDIQSAIRHGK